MPERANRTHIENVKDPEKILLPSSDLSLITLGENESMYRVPFTMLDDLTLDLGQGSASENIGKYINLCAVTGLAHVVSSAIASRTDWLS